MTVTIAPSEVRRTPPSKSTGLRAVRLRAVAIGLGGLGLVAFTAGAFSFFSGLADPRVRKAPPMPSVAQWPELKDGVPALVQGGGADGVRAANATILNLPRPDMATERHAAIATDEFRLRDASRNAAEAPRTIDLPSAKNAAAEQPAVASQVEPLAEPRAELPVKAAVNERPPPPIQEIALVSAEPRLAKAIEAPRVIAAIAPGRAEMIRAKSIEPAAYAALAAVPEKESAPRTESGTGPVARSAETEPKETQKTEAVAEPPQPVEQPKEVARRPEPARTEKLATAKPAPASPRPVQAAAKPTAKPAQTARRPAAPVVNTAANPAPARPVQQAAAAAPQSNDDPEVMGVKIPGSRHIRDGFNAVFGGNQRAN